MSWLLPAALALLVMLPRLASPQFGLLDDGLTLRTGREVVGQWSSVLHLIPETGRFFPAYWLVYAAVFGVVGVRPLGFFAVNVLLLAGLLALLVRLVQLAGGTRRQASAAAVLFALSGPAVETFYTLSKAEPLQMAWIGLSLLAAAASAADGARARRAALAGLAAAALLLAHATKETSLVLLPVSLGWLALERWSSGQPAWARFAGTCAVANLIAALAFAGLRWSYAPLALAEGTYTRAYSLDATTVGAALFRLAAWLVRDFAFLLPLLAAAVLAPTRGGPASHRLLRYAGVWMAGWLAVYVPWPATFAYYLLPFAFGGAMLGGVVVGALSLASRRRAWLVLAPAGLLWSLTVVNAVADGRVQLAVDRANAELVDFLAGLPGGSRVVLNTRRVTEYLYEVPLHLSEIKRRPDVVVEHLAPSGHEAPSPAPVFLATPEMSGQPVPTVRIGLDEAGARHAGATLGAVLAGGGELVYRAGQRA
ncbi:MAG TPA: hypothetical protein VFX28_03945, partial [Methylomirabilota bacterium]|nr:hypothetical protein [Methylomirabilota bacterium]